MAWATAIDLLVGAAFLTAALAARARLAQRVLVGAVGATWLLASWVPATASWHRGLLLVALATFPAGRVRGRARWAAVAAAVLVASGSVPRPAAAAVFAAVSVVVLTTTAPRRAAAWPALSAAGIAAHAGIATALTANSPATVNQATQLVAYELVLLAIAAGFAPASVAVSAARTVDAGRAAQAGGLAGIAGLESVLRGALRDPSLRVERVPGEATVDDGSARYRLRVVDGDHVTATVTSDASNLTDPATARVLTEAVLLTLRNIDLSTALEAQLAASFSARTRLQAAADSERAAMAGELRREVVAPLAAAAAVVRARRSTVKGSGAALAVVADELAVARREVDTVVAGAPPAELGGGRLVVVLRALARTAPIEVELSAEARWAADEPAEVTLYYVCGEALANAVKHASAHRVTVELRRSGGAQSGVVARVSDDGVGGADPHGPGLQGLADRLAAGGGRLEVRSVPGAGTVLTASLPARPVPADGREMS